jgi:hypothetical protein
MAAAERVLIGACTIVTRAAREQGALEIGGSARHCRLEVTGQS